MILDDKKVAWPFTWKKSTGCFNIFSLCVNVIFSSYLQSLQHEARITKRLTLFFVSQTHASTTLVIVFKWTEVIDRQEFLVWLQTLWSIDYFWNWTFLYWFLTNNMVLAFDVHYMILCDTLYNPFVVFGDFEWGCLLFCRGGWVGSGISMLEEVSLLDFTTFVNCNKLWVTDTWKNDQ